MGAVKNAYIRFVDRVVCETGYDWDYVAQRFNDAIDRGMKPVDFFDEIVDEALLGGDPHV